MEQKRNSMFMPLLFSHLASKKNWFFLSTVIIFVTTLLVPYILRTDGEVFIVFGIVEVFFLAFINCLVDNSFLHNDSKLAYYKSKPASFKNQISINIINNLIYTAYLLLLIIISTEIQNLNIEIIEIFKVVIPWLSAGIFLAALSSILSGNTLVAGIMTIFNFALPAIILLITQFMFSILENLVPGFSASVLIDIFMEKFYKLDYIYFIVYSYDKPFDITYVLLLGAILGFITILTFKLLRRRKNENTGNAIAFDGYKYFVSVLACLIIPAFFSITSYNVDILSKVIVSLVMAALTYYIIIAAMEKSFRLSILSMKVFFVSMAAFIAMTGTTIGFANHYKNVVPEAKDVKMAYIGNDRWVINELIKYIDNEEKATIEYNMDLSEFTISRNLILYSDKENIETIREIHKEIILNQDYEYGDYYMNTIVIAYYMNDGSYIIRDYKINRAEGSDEVKDELSTKLFSSKEFKEKKFYYLYDENYYASDKYNIKVHVRRLNGDSDITYLVDYDKLRLNLIKDIDEEFSKTDYAFKRLGNYSHELYYDFAKESDYYIDIILENNHNKSKDLHNTISINSGSYKNTRDFLNLK